MTKIEFIFQRYAYDSIYKSDKKNQSHILVSNFFSLRLSLYSSNVWVVIVEVDLEYISSGLWNFKIGKDITAPAIKNNAEDK